MFFLSDLTIHFQCRFIHRVNNVIDANNFEVSCQRTVCQENEHVTARESPAE